MPPNDASPRPLDDMFGEVYQELHTGQKGLRDSVIESIQEQEHGGGADRGAGADRSGRDA